MAEPNRKLPPLTPQDVQRFWSKVNKDGPVPAHRPELGPCWLWTAARFGKGEQRYGAFSINQKNYRAHRVSHFIATGKDPADRLILHACDNPPCCNPAHLFQGETADNVDDCRKKGRMGKAAGDRHWTRKHPELVKRGNDHPFRRRPELVRRGEDQSQAVLTEDQVRSIRREFSSGFIGKTALSRKYGVSYGCIDGIITRTNWAHVTD
jgi:hypothetical protein